MAYIKTVWEDTPSEDTPIISTALNNIENGIEALDTGKVNISDIVDNLTSTSATKPLSANQGKVIVDTIGTTYDYILTPVTSKYAIAGWRTMATDYTTGVIPAGTYLMIFKFTVSSGQANMGLTTTRAMIDGNELSPQTRITIPTGPATMSGEIIAPVTFATSATHTLNGNTYPLYEAITNGTQVLDYTFIRVK